MTILLVCAGAVVIPLAFFAAVRASDRATQGTGLLTDMADRIRRMKLWQMMLAVAGLGLALVVIMNSVVALPLVLLSLTILFFFVRTWLHEFHALMALRDSDFPGRYDKLIWATLVIFVAPVGVWLFRSYRLAHWPEPEAAPSKPRVAPDLL